jgi:replicative DNA helicase
MAGSPASLDIAITHVDGDDFSIEKHRRIWAAMAGLHRKGTPVDRVTVSEALQTAKHLESVDGMSYLAQLDPLPLIPGIVESYCGILRGYTLRRMAIFQAERLTALAFEGSGSDDLSGVLQSAVEALSAKKLNGSTAMMRADDVLVRDFAGDFTRFVGEGEPIPTCPIPWKEQLGGLRLGELTILAARPGVGKSSAATQIAVAAATAGHGADFWSLEMKAGDILRRAAACQAHVSHFQMQRGFLRDEDRRKVYQALAAMTDLPLWFADNAGASIEHIRRRLRETKARGQPVSLVIVDYLQLMAGVGSGRSNRNDEIGQISRGLKLISLEFRVAVLALSQLSRDSAKQGNRKPELFDLRDSGSLEQDADNVVFIHQPNPEMEGEAKHKEVLWLVRKQRNGHTGETPVMFFPDQMRFVPMVTD